MLWLLCRFYCTRLVYLLVVGVMVLVRQPTQFTAGKVTGGTCLVRNDLLQAESSYFPLLTQEKLAQVLWDRRSALSWLWAGDPSCWVLPAGLWAPPSCAGMGLTSFLVLSPRCVLFANSGSQCLMFSLNSPVLELYGELSYCLKFWGFSGDTKKGYTHEFQI